jgi:putative nucleotidyltransferase with HDIG domain
MSLTLEKIINNAGELVSLPDVFVRVNELVNNPHASAADIGQAVEQDAALTARLLKIVNSPYYGFPSSIDTISRAITIIGIQDLHDLVLATATVGTLSKIDSERINIEKFWRHSLYCAVISKILAEHLHENSTERMFVTGLLHDIGTLVMYQAIPDECSQAIELAKETGQDVHAAEKSIIGFSHNEVGAELATRWNLPGNIIEVIRHHHEPEQANSHPLDVALIHIANFITNTLDESCNRTGNIAHINKATWAMAGLQPTIIEDVLEKADSKFAEMHKLLFPEQVAA